MKPNRRDYGKNDPRFDDGKSPGSRPDGDEDDGPTSFPAPEPLENRGAFDTQTSRRVLGRKTGDDNVYSPDIMPRNDETGT
jgi:hypothetical protein